MLSPLTLSKRISRWVNLNSALFSVSCTSSIQINPEIDQSILNTTDFDAKIHILRNKLYPDSLIKVLQSTSDINSAVKIFKWASLQKRFNHTSDTYFWIILKLGLAGNLKEMEGFCQNWVKDGCSGVEHAVFSLIASFVRHHRLNEAICILVNLCLGGYKPSINVFNMILGALVEDKKGFKEVVFVYKEMVKAGVAPTIDTLNHLMEVLFDTGRVDSALDQYRRMNKKGCSRNSRTFQIVIKGLIVNNQVDESIAILHEMLNIGCLPELSFYTCIIPELCREHKSEEAIRLFRMMRASKFVPNSVIYGALIQCFCKNLQLDDAVNLLEEMVESCLTPDNDVVIDVVIAFCRLGKTNEAAKFLEDINVLETSPYNTLLGACCDAGKFIEAKGLLEKMSERSLADCDSWNILIRCLCEKAAIRKASELLGRMIISSLVPNRATYSALVLGHCRLNKCEDALQLFLQLCTKCWILDYVSYSELIEGLCEAGKHLEATEVFHYMFMNGCLPQYLSFSKLIKGICEKGMVDKAVKLQQMAHDFGMCCANATYNSIMLGLSKSDKGRNVLVFLSQMLVKGCNVDAEAYCILIKSMIAQDQEKDSALFFNAMVNEGLKPDSDTLHKLLSYLANRSRLYLILATIDKLILNSEVLDSGMYNILVYGFWKERLKNEGRRLLDFMLEKGWVPDAATHRLLMGSVEGEESNEKMAIREKFTINDGVLDILAEGLSET
ncbi:pentatricopeptide repeat-containing protein At4g20090 [Ricinus communis]|nr:pentatricopeptide repeat-containing protein At4g20090 [Ricinus communis]|eukprot:XP_015584635.1 pentatricopeptide repeat-containing protein At4g20090 [Ricinus communis]